MVELYKVVEPTLSYTTVVELYKVIESMLSGERLNVFQNTGSN